MEEPPVLRVLDALCHNEELRAMGYATSQMAKIGWLQRLLAPFIDIRSDKIQNPSNET
jgi:hypothetical protein